MNEYRATLTDGSGKWVDLEKCTIYDERRVWDGDNLIGAVTRSQWVYESLYRTQSGRWVLWRSSDWQGDDDSWAEIDNEAAAGWLGLANFAAKWRKAENRQFEALDAKRDADDRDTQQETTEYVSQ